MVAFQAAVKAGVSPADFWGFTPYLTRKAMESITDRRTTDSWMTANLSRAKDLPKLSDLMQKKTDRAMDPLKQRLMVMGKGRK